MDKQVHRILCYTQYRLKTILTLNGQIIKANVGQIFLVEVIIYALIFLWDDYIGFFLSVVMACIVTAILIISLVVEWIEHSKVPLWYYSLMGISILSPLLVLLFFSMIEGIHFFNLLLLHGP